ncbi:MAG: hypothetical protein AAB316_20940 [Bacteroidota bacterium]
MLKILPLLFFLLAFADLAAGQKFLQLEKVHSPRTRKFFTGDEITFQLKGGQWYTRVIEDISYEEGLVVFANGHAKVEDITAFRSFKNKRWSKPIGNQLINFAIAWAGFALITAAVDDEEEYSKSDAFVSGTAAGMGLLVKGLFKKRTFQLSKNKKGEAKRWRLRVLDLEVK